MIDHSPLLTCINASPCLLSYKGYARQYAGSHQLSKVNPELLLDCWSLHNDFLLCINCLSKSTKGEDYSTAVAMDDRKEGSDMG